MKVLIVALLAVLLLEALVRLAGFAASRAAHVKPDAPGSSARTVLCIGDSFVWGVGGISFPVQLQDILRQRYGPGAFKVINAGRAGTNSSYVVALLPKALKQDNPDAVIILTGMSNSWKRVREDGGFYMESWFSRHVRLYQVFELLKSGEYVLGYKQARAAARMKELEAQEAALLSGVSPGLSQGARERLVKLYCASAGLFYDRMDQENSERELAKAMVLGRGGGPEVLRDLLRACLHCHSREKLEMLLDSVAALPPDEAAFARGKLYVWQGDFANGKKFLEQAIKLNSGFWVYYTALGELLLVREPEAAVRCYRKAIALVPSTPFPHHSLGLLWLWFKNYRDAEAEFKLAVRADPGYAEPLRRLADIYAVCGFAGRFETLRWEIPALAVSPEYWKLRRGFEANRGAGAVTPEAQWLADITKAVQLVRESGLPAIVSSYPDRNLQGVREAAEKSGAEYVDLTGAFKQRFKTRQDYASFDKAHCNTAGYRLMAEVYAEKIAQLFGMKQTGAATAAPASKTRPR